MSDDTEAATVAAKLLGELKDTNTAARILACLERIELLLSRRLPRQSPTKKMMDNAAIPTAAIFEAWREINPTLEQPTMITPKRRTLLRGFWRRFQTVEGGAMEGVRGVFEMVAASDFLSGRSGSWKANMWWVMEPDHLAAIIEGRYRNEARTRTHR